MSWFNRVKELREEVERLKMQMEEDQAAIRELQEHMNRLLTEKQEQRKGKFRTHHS